MEALLRSTVFTWKYYQVLLRSTHLLAKFQIKSKLDEKNHVFFKRKVANKLNGKDILYIMHKVQTRRVIRRIGI